MSWCIVILGVLLTGNYFGDHVKAVTVTGLDFGLPLELIGTLQKLEDVDLSQPKTLKSFVCRINVTDIFHINEKVLLEAINLMNKNITTCPLEKESAMIEDLVKIWTQFKTPTMKNLMAMVDSTVRLILKTVNITGMEKSMDKHLYLLVSNMKSYYAKNPNGNIFKILGKFLCSIEKIDLANLSTTNLMDLVESIDRETCSGEQQKVILEKFVKMLSISQWLYPENIFRFFKSDIFERMIGKEFAEFFKIIDFIKERKIIHWTVVDFGHRFLCNLISFNISQIGEKNIEEALMKMWNEPNCSKESVSKWISTTVNEIVQIVLLEVEKDFKINVSDVMRISDKDIQVIVQVIDFMKKSENLDTLIETISDILQKNFNELAYILKFMACNFKTTDILNMDLNKIMNFVGRIYTPLTCTSPTPNDWLKEFIKQMLKIPYDLVKQLEQNFGDKNGNSKKKNSEYIVNEIDKLIKLAMTNAVKVASALNQWFNYTKQNGYMLHIPTLGRHLICFIEKMDFSSIETVINSLGGFGQCTSSEITKSTESFFQKLDLLNLGYLKEFFIGNDKFNSTRMKIFFKKVNSTTDEFIGAIWSIIPQEIKELTIAKVYEVVRKEMTLLDEPVRCMVKAITWPLFGQPDTIDFIDCFKRTGITPTNPSIKPKPQPGKRPGEKLEDRYKVGDDFPLTKMQLNKASPEELLPRLLSFTREPNTEKETRILNYVTKRVIDYLLDNPTKFNEVIPTYKNHILKLASKVNRVVQILSKMEIVPESLSIVKKISTPRQAKMLLNKVMKEVKLKSVDEQKNFIRKIPKVVLMKSGTQLIDNFFTEETKKVFIGIFKRKKEPQTYKKMMEDNVEEEDEEEENDEGEVLAKLNLVDKLMEKSSDDETMSLIMNTSLVSVIPINILKTLPSEKMCSMKAETTELNEAQTQYLINSCPKSIEKIAKTNANSLGKIVTKVTKNIVNSLNLKELIDLTLEACTYETELDIDLEIVFKNRYITENLNPMKNSSSMFCVLKQIQKELPWKQPQAIKICQILGNSILKKIPPKRAEFFKTQCMVLLKKRNITIVDMGSMNTLLTKDDIQNLEPQIILEGALVFSRYVWNMEVFTEVGKKISELPSFKQRSNLTTDQVAQANIFIAAWEDADTIPKASILETYDSIAKSVRLLQKKKIQCLKKGKDASTCNVMDKAIGKIVVKILIKALSPSNSRRKRSTKDSCHCTNILNLGVAAVQIPAEQMTKMICASDFNECMEGLSQVTNWNQDHRDVFKLKAIEFWGEPDKWNSSHMSIASAVVPGLSTNQIKTLRLDSMDTAFYLGKQNNWDTERLKETFLLFLKYMKNNSISSITNFDLQALGNIVCGISVEHIRLIPKSSYINAASQIGNLEICSQDQLTAWAEKALAVYGTDVNSWGSAEIASIGSVISGFSVEDFQKLNQKQIAAIAVNTIPNIISRKLASLHPKQIGYLTTSQVQMITSAQKAKMSDEQRTILNKKVLGMSTTSNDNSGGQTIEGRSFFKWSILLISLEILTTFLSGF